MNESMRDGPRRDVGVLDTSAVRAFHDRLDTSIPERADSAGKAEAGPGVADQAPGDRVEDLLEELRAVDELRNALTARQARLVVAVADAQAARDVPRGIQERDTTRLVGSQVGFARRCTPHRGAAFVRLAHALVDDMPHTLAALAAGVVDEDTAAKIVRETTGLSRRDRARVDDAIAPQLGTTSTGRLTAAARAHAYWLDPDAARARRHTAEADRRVSLRPAQDQMARLSALLPIKDGLACMAVLDDAVTTARQGASEAGAVCRGQVMADTLVARVTGRSRMRSNLGACVNLLVPTDTLLGDTPAHVPGYGPVPADLVRDWITDGDPAGPKLRRLFTHPGTGDIIGMDSHARRYPGLLARLILFRDDTCRTPWCGAPIRHTDHITPHARGGATSERNGQGLCERCNYVKEHPDYRVTGHAGHTTTRAGGFTATSRPPAPPGQPPPTSSHPGHTLMTILWQHNLAAHDRHTERADFEGHYDPTTDPDLPEHTVHDPHDHDGIPDDDDGPDERGGDSNS